MNQNTDKTNNHELLYELAQELSSLIIREHQILRAELNQVGVLVDDAVQSLGGNFRALKECIADQKSEAATGDQSDDGSNVVTQGASAVHELPKQVDLYTTNMMRALQFDDIVQQLAGHADERIGQMQELFHVLDMNLSELRSTESEVTHKTQAHLQIMLENVTKYRELLEKSNPVKQESMGEGGIELF